VRLSTTKTRFYPVINCTFRQERRIRGLESAHDVKITVNRSKSEVRLEGSSDSLHSVVPAIYAIIMEVKDKEKTDRELELLAKQVMMTLQLSIHT